MKKVILTAFVLSLAIVGFSQRKAQKLDKPSATTTASAETSIPKELQGTWMYGNFSTTEYWSTSPGTYLGNALTFAIAFTFHADGTYEQYFTSSSVMTGVPVYHQSFTKGSFKVDEAASSITTTSLFSHYKRTRGSVTEEDRDMKLSELSASTTYRYKKGLEPNGTASIQLTITGSNSPLTFLKKQF